MTSRPELEAILEELRTLGDRDLRFTLSVMRPQEQAEILELLDTRSVASLSFETLAGISPWLTKRMELARRPDRTIDDRVSMTKATADALSTAFATLNSAANHLPSKEEAIRSASWLDRFLRRPIKGVTA